MFPAPINRVLAAENGFRSILGIVVEEGAE
jgi:hypothetical protein